MRGDPSLPSPHCRPGEPSPWIRRFAPLLPVGASVLDLACGAGRHARFFLSQGARVTCVDRDLSAVNDLAGLAELIQVDLESGDDGVWPLAGRCFDSVVVVNYLSRPLIPTLIDAIAPGGLLLYETFAQGNERYGRPRNPDHLLCPGELLTAVADRLQVVGYEAGLEERSSGRAVVQRLCAKRGHGVIILPQPSPYV